MKVQISSRHTSYASTYLLLLGKWDTSLVPSSFRAFLKTKEKEIKNHKEVIIHAGDRVAGIWMPDMTEPRFEIFEKIRRLAAKLRTEKNSVEISVLYNAPVDSEMVMESCVALALSHYRFEYFLSSGKNKTSVAIHASIPDSLIKKAEIICRAVFLCRDWVNYPVNFLNAPTFAQRIKELEKDAPLRVQILNKKQIEKLKMGGLLAVNKGSVDEPRFIVMEYNPGNSKNKKPLVLVGKGVVYDTGGLSLKSTLNSMDYMKCDMAGGALVATAVYAAARLKVPRRVVALIPSTDNRPGFNAFAPGDVIRMMDGSTVEMLNSDAEGRMILADALHYAKRYKPELVLEFSTLTGAAANAIGHFAMVGMGKIPEEQKKKIFQSSFHTGERIAEFPFWEDYDELLKSEIADCKNIGGTVAGAITAGRFLHRFTSYPYYHLDIAGPAFIQNRFHYLPKGGTGFGVRFLIDFLEKY